MKKKLLLSFALLSALISNAQSLPAANVNIVMPPPLCSPGTCTQLLANYTPIKATTSYNVSTIGYNPLFPYTGGTVLNASADDIWSPTVTLPFTFCFYGNNYNTLLVGSNGVVTFDTTNQAPNQHCPYAFASPIPDPLFPIKNAIYGVYQDTNIESPPVTNPQVQNVNYYVLQTGVHAAPNRVFVINFNQLPTYSCNTAVGLQTSQIVLHESTNIIDVYVENRTACSNASNNGMGLIGVQNESGTIATVPSERNSGTWTATNEAWRFSPNGATVPVIFNWYADGILIPQVTSQSITTCPFANTSYRVDVSYVICGSTVTVQSPDMPLTIAQEPPFYNPLNLSVCPQENPVYTVNISENTLFVLNGLNPNDYEVHYYENEDDAHNFTNNYITSIFNYSFTENRTLYIAVEDIVNSGCIYVKPFQLIIHEPVSPPTGDAEQTLLIGQTLADIAISPTDVVWYDVPNFGNVLPETTVLQDNATYYAAAVNPNNGCESRNTNSTRFGVTVHLVLSNNAFDKKGLQVFPNPMHTILNVVNVSKIESVEIYNAIGQKVITRFPENNESKIDVSQLNPGVYFVKVLSDGQQQTLKIIKN